MEGLKSTKMRLMRTNPPTLDKLYIFPNSHNVYLRINLITCLIAVITGPQRRGVVGARSRIEVITESSKQKIPFTHFLCFPLYKSNLEKKVDEFKVRVLKDCFEVSF